MIDTLNIRTMGSVVNHYDNRDKLTPSEISALYNVPDIKDQPILDIGVGAGRTTPALLKISDDYLGVDYVPEMVNQCQKKFPVVCFDQADARDMSKFADESFHTVFFSMNGLCMVDHEGRIAILKEISRLLKPEGAFLFSTYNRDSALYLKTFQFPHFNFTLNPARFTVRSMRFLRSCWRRTMNRLHYKKAEVHTPEYAIINDVCHNYGTMLYYCSHDVVEQQLRELSADELKEVVSKVAGPMIEKLASEMIERIAWEVVPDLAESMISEEIRKIKEGE